MNKGFYSVMAAEFFSSLADNALLIVAIALLAQMNAAPWMTPLLRLFFVMSYVGLAAFVGAFADALPKQQKMLMQSSLLIIPFFRQQTQPLLKPADQSSLNYFASAWCALENMLLAATAEGLGTVFHIPVSDEAEKIKQIVNAPEGYEFTCLLTMGYPTENAFLPKQKEIHIAERIHTDVW